MSILSYLQEMMTEDVFGKLVTTYHRTSKKENVYSIAKASKSSGETLVGGMVLVSIQHII